MSLEEKAKHIVERARDLAPRVKSWAEFSNELFSQEGGLVANTFPRMKDRRAFYDTPQYQEVNQILLSLIKRFGVAEGAEPGQRKMGVAANQIDQKAG